MGILFFAVCSLAGAGSPAPPQQEAGGGVLWTVRSAENSDRFGSALASIGDVDGDGVDDAVAGAPHADPAGLSSGRVRVLSGRDGRELARFEGWQAGSWFGFSVDGAGDVDRDGFPDVIVGSPLGPQAGGSAQLYSGADGRLLWSWSGASDGERFGQAVSAAGDVDADGFPDVVIGSPQDDTPGLLAGSARVFSGRSGALLLSCEGSTGDLYGSALDALADVDGDGCDDFLIGAPLADGAAGTVFNAGEVVLISGASGEVLRTFTGAAVGDQLGADVAALGDLDGDGVREVCLGIPAADAGGIDSGAAEVRSAADGSLRFTIAGARPGEYLAAVAGTGDVDGDGTPDVIVGAASAASQDGAAEQVGRVQVHSGADGRELCRFFGGTERDWFGASVSGAGDRDGDGRADILAGAPGHDDELDSRGYVQGLACGADASPLPAVPKKRGAGDGLR